MRPSGPSSCCHAILANSAPSGQGLILPDCAAFTAISLPRMKRKVWLSPRSVVLISFQVSKFGSKGNPLNSGGTAVKDTGAGIATGVLGGWLGAGVHGARYAFRV